MFNKGHVIKYKLYKKTMKHKTFFWMLKTHKKELCLEMCLLVCVYDFSWAVHNMQNTQITAGK